jgi:hypothetical protein
MAVFIGLGVQMFVGEESEGLDLTPYRELFLYKAKEVLNKPLRLIRLQDGSYFVAQRDDSQEVITLAGLRPYPYNEAKKTALQTLKATMEAFKFTGILFYDHQAVIVGEEVKDIS